MTNTAALLSLVIGAALYGLVTRVLIPPATWLALTLLLHASRSLPPGTGTLALWVSVFAALAFGNRELLPVGGPANVGINAALAATIAVPFLADRLLAPRIGHLASTLVFPAALVAAEFLRSRLTPAATWNSLAYTQYGWLPLMQVAAFVGIWGITFLLGWTASTLEVAWARSLDWSAIRVPAAALGASLLFVVFWGSVRVALAPTDRPSIRAVTLNRPLDLFIPGEMTQIASGRVSAAERPAFAAKLARLHDWFLEGSRREARAGAALVAWPEQNLLVFAEDEAAFLARAQRLAAEEHIYLVMGLGTIHLGTPLPFENKSVVIDRSGRILVSYLKSHPVEGWEASIMRRGDGRLPVVDTPDGRMATAICYDADFPEFVRQAGRGNADLLIVPANEWRAIKEVHVQMAVFRAIENGVPLLRPAASGLSVAADAWGRVLGMSDYFSDGDRTMTAHVPLGRIPTLYARTGDVFAWLCVAGVMVAGLAGIVAR